MIIENESGPFLIMTYVARIAVRLRSWARLALQATPCLLPGLSRMEISMVKGGTRRSLAR